MFYEDDGLNTFYLQLYGIKHMINDHSDREETHCRHYLGYSFQLATDRIAHITAFLIPVVEHWLTDMTNQNYRRQIKKLLISLIISFCSFD